MKIIIFFVMNAFLIKENSLIKDYHSNLQSSLSYFIFFPSFCYIWSSCNKEKNKPPFLMQKMSLKLRIKLTNHWLPRFHLLFNLFIYGESRSRTVLEYM